MIPYSKLVSKSNSNRTSVIDTIYEEPSNNKSRAALLLLNKFFYDQDETTEKAFRMKKINFSRETLLRWQADLNTLFCVYCNEPDLEIELEGMNLKVKATIEHLQPTSLGGEHFNLLNIVCACNKCNSKRSNQLLSSFLKVQKICPTKFDLNCKKYLKLKKP